MHRTESSYAVLIAAALASVTLSSCHGTRTFYENLESGFALNCYQQIAHAAEYGTIRRFRQTYRFSSCVRSHPNFLDAEELSASFHQEQAIVSFEKCAQLDPSPIFKRACNLDIATELSDIADYRAQKAYKILLLKYHSEIPPSLARKTLSGISKRAPWLRSSRPNPTEVSFTDASEAVTLPVYRVRASVPAKVIQAQLKKGSISSLNLAKRVGSIHEISHVKYLIPVRAQGMSGWMILDTGTAESIVRPSFVNQLRLLTHRSSARIDFRAERNWVTPRLFYTSLRFTVGRDTFAHQRMLSFLQNGSFNSLIRVKNLDGRPVIGILGLDFLRKFGSIRIDFETRKVYFGAKTTNGYCRSLSLGNMTPPISRVNRVVLQLIGDTLMMRATLANKEVAWVIDSGWDANSIANGSAQIVSEVSAEASAVHTGKFGYKVFTNVPTDATTNGEIDLQVVPNQMRLLPSVVVSAPTAFSHRYIGFNFDRGTVCYQ